MELTFDEKIAKLHEEVEIFVGELKSITIPDYDAIEKEMAGLKTKLDIDDPALSGIYNITVQAAKLSQAMSRAGEMFNSAIKNKNVWKDALVKAENLYEKFKGILLTDCKDVTDKKNQQQQLATATTHPSIERITKIYEKIKKESAIAMDNLLQCEKLTERIEFASKCLGQQINSIDKQIQIQEVVKRENPDDRYTSKSNQIKQ